jgi:hypothetical protein
MVASTRWLVVVSQSSHCLYVVVALGKLDVVELTMVGDTSKLEVVEVSEVMVELSDVEFCAIVVVVEESVVLISVGATGRFDELVVVLLPQSAHSHSGLVCGGRLVGCPRWEVVRDFDVELSDVGLTSSLVLVELVDSSEVLDSLVLDSVELESIVLDSVELA